MTIYPHLLVPSPLRSFARPRSAKRQYLAQHNDSPPTTKGRKALHRITFDSLPIELQVEIFFLCLPPFPRFSVQEAPIVLARVCRSWRSIVLSTSRLWSSFEVEIQGSGASGLSHDSRLMHRMKLWLERSGCYPLFIRLLHNPVGRVSDDRSAQFLAALVPEARRWRNAHLILPAASIAQLQSLPPNSFPTLRSLTLKVTGSRSSPSDPPLNITAMNIPWRQLTALDLQLERSILLTLDGGLDILSNTVNLKRGTLHLECSWNRHDAQWDKLSLPALENLQLILQSGDTSNTAAGSAARPEACLVQFLSLLHLPKLRVLHLGWLVNSSMGHWSSSHTEFVAFLQASADTLRELTMTYLPIAENELLECLSQVPKLTHLDLRFAMNEEANDPITNQFLVKCTIPSSTVSPGIARRRQAHAETALLPRLEHVNLQCHGALYANATLLTLIQSRWEPDQRSDDQASRRQFRSFRLLSMKPVSSMVEKHVKAWHEAGLEVDIQCLVIR
ncbi:hypothetical protein BYT27DRAFT_7333377 [Phlegmacium glaucopus]|nr:hypothetical protein BYT27DRAFT_7333377 [Phlegmacium glaucopus]